PKKTTPCPPRPSSRSNLKASSSGQRPPTGPTAFPTTPQERQKISGDNLTALGPGTCTEITARNFSRRPARQNSENSLCLAHAFTRCVATGNKPADSPHVRSGRLSLETSSAAPNRKSSACRFATRTLAGPDRARFL